MTVFSIRYFFFGDFTGRSLRRRFRQLSSWFIYVPKYLRTHISPFLIVFLSHGVLVQTRRSSSLSIWSARACERHVFLLFFSSMTSFFFWYSWCTKLSFLISLLWSLRVLLVVVMISDILFRNLSFFSDFLSVFLICRHICICNLERLFLGIFLLCPRIQVSSHFVVFVNILLLLEGLFLVILSPPPPPRSMCFCFFHFVCHIISSFCVQFFVLLVPQSFPFFESHEEQDACHRIT